MPNPSFSLGRMSQSLRRLVILIVLAAVYYFAARIGLRFAYINSSVTTIWPPAGIALAAFVLYGYRVWPAILGAAFLANFTTTGMVLPSIGIAIGNTLEGLAAAYLVTLAGVLPRWPRVTWVLPLVWLYLGCTRVRHAGTSPLATLSPGAGTTVPSQPASSGVRTATSGRPGVLDTFA